MAIKLIQTTEEQKFIYDLEKLYSIKIYEIIDKKTFDYITILGSIAKVTIIIIGKIIRNDQDFFEIEYYHYRQYTHDFGAALLNAEQLNELIKQEENFYKTVMKKNMMLMLIMILDIEDVYVKVIIIK